MTDTVFAAPRRRVLLAAAALLATPAILRAQSLPVLRVGNQKGGVRSLLEASGQDKGAPYRLEWSEFPAAAPLLEALNAGMREVFDRLQPVVASFCPAFAARPYHMRRYLCDAPAGDMR